ncbi:HNH endonuclease signature motif containing protein [Streptomyces sp.]|uniref:HNH endonuclease signature motif containing protein n=1 Tax=Streptomyces sp. TaxID=1931 RepID=UPI0039C8C70A
MPSKPRQGTCGECRQEKTTRWKRGLCETCYRRSLARERGVQPRVVVVDPLLKVFGRTTPGPDGCVFFTGRVRGDGYGGVSLGNRREASAHRVAYELMVGPIPPGLTIDHLCHNRSATCSGGRACLHRRCVNPFHLEPVSSGENTKRAVQRPNANWGEKRSGRRQAGDPRGECGKGHEVTQENTVWEKRSATSDMRRPRCRACIREYHAARRARERMAA